MSHEHEMAAPYVLDALDDLDRTRFERHLDTCAECRDDVNALREGLDQIAASDAVSPPPAVRPAVLGQIESIQQLEPETARDARSARTTTRVWMLVAALAALVVTIVAVLNASTNGLDDLLAESDTRVVAVTATEAYEGSAFADAVVSGDGETVYLRAENLEPVADGSVYAAWIIGVDGPVPAGLFTPGADGSVTLSLEGSAGPGVVLGVTIEPDGGSPLPTGDVLFLGDLG